MAFGLPDWVIGFTRIEVSSKSQGWVGERGGSKMPPFPVLAMRQMQTQGLWSPSLSARTASPGYLSSSAISMVVYSASFGAGHPVRRTYLGSEFRVRTELHLSCFNEGFSNTLRHPPTLIIPCPTLHADRILSLVFYSSGA